MEDASPIVLTLRSQLVTVAIRYAAAKDLKLPTVSAMVLNAGHRLGDLASEASDITTVTFEAAMRWFSERWPDDVEWPAGIARPKVKKREAA